MYTQCNNIIPHFVLSSFSAPDLTLSAQYQLVRGAENMVGILVIGSGGREHAICWKLSQSDQISKIFALPGSVGIGTLPKVENVNNVALRDGYKVSVTKVIL